MNMKKKVVKKVVKKTVKRPIKHNPNQFGCNVPLSYITGNEDKPGFCNGQVYIGWSVGGVGGRVCNRCHARHCDENDKFSLYEAFGVVKPETLNVMVDRFGFELAKDDPKRLNKGKLSATVTAEIKTTKKVVKKVVKKAVKKKSYEFTERAARQKIAAAKSAGIDSAITNLLSDFF